MILTQTLIIALTFKMEYLSLFFYFVKLKLFDEITVI